MAPDPQFGGEQLAQTGNTDADVGRGLACIAPSNGCAYDLLNSASVSGIVRAQRLS